MLSLNSLRYFLFFTIQCIFSCNNPKVPASENSGKSTLTIQLPFESSNYAESKNFTLYDSVGKECVADLDTVTKGGGTIIYDDLSNGTYTYLIHTVFDEDIKKTFHLDSNIYISFYEDCYDIKNDIKPDSLKAAEKIDLRIEIMKDFRTGEVYVFKLSKKENRYFLKYRLNEDKGWGSAVLMDSAKVMRSLTEFIAGLHEMNVMEEAGYPSANSVYIKVDNQFMQVDNLDTVPLQLAIKRLKGEIGAR